MRAAIVVVLSILITANTYAVGFGLAPSIMDLKDLTRGQSVKERITIYNSQNETLTVYPNAEDYSEWIVVMDESGNELSEISVSPNSYRDVIVKITVPEDAANGVYEIPLYFETKPSEKGTGVGVKSPVKIKLEVVGKQRISVDVLSYEVVDAEVGVPAKFAVSIMNDGNVVAKPEFRVTVMDGENVIFEGEKAVEISPREIKTLKMSWDTSKAEEKTYNVRLTVTVNGSEVFSKVEELKVFEKGTLTASLYIINASMSKAVVGKQAKLGVTVKNTGYIDYETKLKIEVYRGGDFVQALQSDPLWLERGKIGELTVYFNFEEPGTYTLKPVITYAGKIAVLEDLTINVNVEEERKSTPGLTIFAATLATLLAAAVWRKVNDR